MSGNGPVGDRVLWKADGEPRWFLVPDAVQPPPGPLVLRAGAARVVHAHPAAVAPFEVSREEGLAFMDARLDAFADETQARVEAWLNRVAPRGGEADARARGDAAHPAAASGSGDEDSAPPTDAPAREYGPGAKLFASLTGQPAVRAMGSPEALLRGLGTLLSRAADTVAEARTGEEGRAAATARIRALGDQLRAHGISAPPATPVSADRTSPANEAVGGVT